GLSDRALPAGGNERPHGFVAHRGPVPARERVGKRDVRVPVPALHRALRESFVGFAASVGTPSGGGGTITIPVTVTFSNHASFPDTGTLTFLIESATQVDCGGGSFSIAVPPGNLYDQTQDVTLSSGCSPSGGQILSTYSTGGTPISLPPEAIP